MGRAARRGRDDPAADGPTDRPLGSRNVRRHGLGNAESLVGIRLGPPSRYASAPYKIGAIVLAAITLTEIVQLIAVATVLHVVLLAPIVLAVFFAWLEFRQNQNLRRARF